MPSRAGVVIPRDDQVPRHRREVLVDLQPLPPQHRLVPPGPVLAATSDVGHDVGAPALQPAPADDPAVRRRERHLEAAVAREQRRPCRRVRLSHHEVRDAGAVVGGGEVLAHPQPGRVEERRRGLDGHGLVTDHAVAQGGRLQEPAGADEVLVAGVGVRADDVGAGERRDPAQRLPRPAVVPRRQHLHPGGDVLQHRQDQVVPGPGVVLQRRARVRLEQHLDVALPLHPGVHVGGEETAGRVRRAADLPPLRLRTSSHSRCTSRSTSCGTSMRCSSAPARRKWSRR